MMGLAFNFCHTNIHHLPIFDKKGYSNFGEPSQFLVPPGLLKLTWIPVFSVSPYLTTFRMLSPANFKSLPSDMVGKVPSDRQPPCLKVKHLQCLLFKMVSKQAF